uniref:Uncharacterized protein n=1 Tax=viral metagenome TaxID=1070528 RepID=A0A6C0LKG1_9ZZZZ
MLKQSKFIDDKLPCNTKRQVCKNNSAFELSNEKTIKENLFDPSQSSPPNDFLKSLLNRLNK